MHLRHLIVLALQSVKNHGIIGMEIKLISKIESIKVFMRKILIEIHIE
jgi:hypothetical protein